MRASLVRRALGGIVPPKIATPSHLVSRLDCLDHLDKNNQILMNFIGFLRDLFYSLEAQEKAFHPSSTSTPNCRKAMHPFQALEV